MYLLIFSASFFIIFGAAAFIKIVKPLWAFVDVIYYPLGALGVMILFFQQDLERKLLELQEIQNQKQQELSNIESIKPQISSHGLEDVIISSKKLLDSTISLGKACDEAISTSYNCMVYSKVYPILSRYTKYFPSDGAKPDIYLICLASSDILNDIKAEKIFSKTISDLLIEQYKDGVDKGLQWTSVYGLNSFIAQFNDSAAKHVEQVALLLKDNSDAQNYFIGRTSEEIVFAKRFFKIFNSCLWAQEEIRNGKYEKWRKNYISAEKSFKETLSDIANIEMERRNPKAPDPFRYIYWPFILTFALSLKFGKSISAIEVDIRKYFSLKI